MATTLKMEPAEPKEGLTEAKGAQSPLVAVHTNVVHGLGSIVSVRGEIDDVLADMKVFHKAEPDQVMAAVSAHSARLVEIVVQIGRVEVTRREWKPVREEAEKVLTELKAQFQVASRQIAIRQMDYEMSRGGS